MKVSYNFAGSVVLVTGGASGIGAATARACAAAGAQVVVFDVQQVGFDSPRIECVELDVGDPAAVRAAVDEVIARHGRVDAAVLAAAIQSRAPLESVTDESWRRHMAVNLDGVFHFMRELAPVMRRQRKGSIVAFTSGLVGMGWPGAAAYAASKGALIGLAKCAAQELRADGVRVNVLSPGVTSTPIFMNVASRDEVQMYERGIGVSPPEDVVPTVMYLVSDASANLTGSVVERRLVPG